VAALEGLIAAHPEWAGKVAGLMVNQEGAESGLESCAEETKLPIGQDGPGNPTWTVLGANYNAVVVVDAAGKLVHKVSPAKFDEEGIQQLTEVVAALLQQNP
jgi:hypothetical protein